MFRSSPYETAIELTSAIKDHVTQLSACYQDLLKMIDAEHAAISRSDLQTIEDIVEHKTAIGANIEAEVTAIRQLGVRTATVYEKVFQTPIIAPISITACYDLLKSIRESIQEDTFVVQLFDRVLSNLDNVIKSFKTLREQTEPKIEMNRYLTERLLHQHQESYRFWQSVAQESQATYDAGGSQRSSTTPPVLRVKA